MHISLINLDHLQLTRRIMGAGSQVHVDLAVKSHFHILDVSRNISFDSEDYKVRSPSSILVTVARFTHVIW